MSIKWGESPTSHEINRTSSDNSTTLRFVAITDGTETESAIELYALTVTPATIGNLVRNSLRVSPESTNLFNVEIGYGTTGVNGGDQPLGGESGDNSAPQQPQPPESNSQPLKNGWSFHLRAQRIHFTTSIQTSASAKRGGGEAPNYMHAIGVDEKGKVVGVDWPPDADFTFTRTVAMPVVTLDYLNTLAECVGCMNDDTFYGFAAGEVLLVEASGNFESGNDGQGWSVTFSFGVKKNTDNLTICEDLPKDPDTLPKLGWEYCWTQTVQELDAGRLLARPMYAYVEQLVYAVDYSQLGIGT